MENFFVLTTTGIQHRTSTQKAAEDWIMQHKHKWEKETSAILIVKEVARLRVEHVYTIAPVNTEEN